MATDGPQDRQAPGAGSADHRRGPAWWTRLTSPQWVARLVVAAGILSLISAFTRPDRERLRLLLTAMPRSIPIAATAATAAAGLLLLVVAYGLSRGRQRSWWAAVCLLLGAVGLHVLKGLDLEEAAVCLAVTIPLLAGRRHFATPAQPRSGRVTLAVTCLTIVCGSGIGWALLSLAQRRQQHPTSSAGRLIHAMAGLFGAQGPVRFHREADQSRFSTALLVLGVVGIATVIGFALRPASVSQPITPAHAARLRGLISAHGGCDSLASSALAADRCVVFSAGGGAAISYHIAAGVCLANGNPVGDPREWASAINGWVQQARHSGWIPAVVAADETGRAAFAQAGLSSMEMGDEAILIPAQFRLDDPGLAAVSSAVQAVAEAGYRISCGRVRDVGTGEAAATLAMARSWRGGEYQRGFEPVANDPAARGTKRGKQRAANEQGANEQGAAQREAEAAGVLVRALDDAGRLRGMAHFAAWGPDGVCLNLLRCDAQAHPGTAQAMLAALLTAAPELGLDRVSLNVAAVRGVFDRGQRLGAGPVMRARRAVLLWWTRHWQIEALQHCASRLRPQWRPRYLCYAATSDLGAIAVAALRTQAGTGGSRWRRPPIT